jgi:branched-chain amino acid transport system substrate-binding protein
MLERPARLTAGIVLAVVIAACSGGDDSTPEPTIATTSTVPERERVDDGQLRIGGLLPTNDALVGEPMSSALSEAVLAVNSEGGVLGQEVDLLVEDEGDSAATAVEAIDTLLTAEVDAIIGPASSIIALDTLDDILAAEVLVCSPSATALALDDFPDDEGLFFRTIPSDSLQAGAMAEVVVGTGEPGVAIVHVDDAYGRPFAEATAREVARRGAGGVELVETIAVGVGVDDLMPDAQALVDSGAGVAVVIGSGADTSRFLAALNGLDFDPLGRIIVNDAARDPETQPVISTLDSDLRTRIVGVAPQIELPADEQFSVPGPFASQVTDCVNLISLSAIQTSSDRPTDIATAMAPVSSGGLRCRTFEACAGNLELGRQINYAGPSNALELARDGDLASARFEIFEFDQDGRSRTDPADSRIVRR